MDGDDILTRWRAGTAVALGLGWLAGGAEAVWVLGTSRDVGGVIERLGLVLAAVAVGGVAGVLCGLVAGGVHGLTRDRPVHRAVALQAAIAALLLTGIHLTPPALSLYAQGRAVQAVAVGLMPWPTAGMVYFTARWALARVAMGAPSPVSWRVASLGGAVGLGALAVVLAPFRDTGGGFTLADDPNVVVISVDGLPLGLPATDEAPALSALAADGTTFGTAVAPSPYSVPSHASLWTGLHPLRHRAISDAHALSRGWRTIPERLQREGWATAAFVSSAIVRDVGLDQGFTVFDAVFGPLGWERLRLPRLVVGPGPVRRPGANTVARFENWLGAHADAPFLAWIHLEVTGEHGPADVDIALGRVRKLVDEAGIRDRTMVVVVGAHGGPADRPRSGLDDAHVRVPLLVRAPGKPRVDRVDLQVRTVDVPLTILAWMGLDRNDEAEGIELLGFLDGRRDKGVWTPLVGEIDGEDAVIGLRQDDLTFVYAPALDEAHLYRNQPDGERVDLGPEQPEAMAQARAMLGPDLAAMRALRGTPDLGPSRHAVLRALGVAR